jgi:SpoVK/Ycf46/Vps4 family AAA+-type ATPase
MPLASNADATALGIIAKRCEGLAGAALEAIVNEAAICAARRYQRLRSARRLEAVMNGDGSLEPPAREVGIEDFEAALTSFMRSFDE